MPAPADGPFGIQRPVSPFGDQADGHPPLGYGPATGEPAEGFARAAQPRRAAGARPAPASPLRRPETRAAARTHWKNARQAAEAMLLAARNGQLMELLIAADNLDFSMGQLWALRSTRDINWRAILNHAQGMLRQAFAAKQVEQLTAEQCCCIRELVERHLGPATRTAEDLAEAVRLIEDAGFDPYGAISGDPPDGPE
jgi:hypothetical protein